jgi:hypothetical protein
VRERADRPRIRQDDLAVLAAGGALAAVLAPRQVYLLAGALGCAVTAVLAARLRSDWAHRTNISFATERSRA